MVHSRFLAAASPTLSPDLVAWVASLPTPCSRLELSSLSLQSFQTQQGLSGSTLASARRVCSQASSSRGRADWGHQTQLAFCHPQGRVCSTQPASAAQPPLSESSPPDPPHPPGLTVALSMEPLLPWPVPCSLLSPPACLLHQQIE